MTLCLWALGLSSLALLSSDLIPWCQAGGSVHSIDNNIVYPFEYYLHSSVSRREVVGESSRARVARVAEQGRWWTVQNIRCVAHLIDVNYNLQCRRFAGHRDQGPPIECQWQ